MPYTVNTPPASAHANNTTIAGSLLRIHTLTRTIIPTLTAANWPSAIRRMRFELGDGWRCIGVVRLGEAGGRGQWRPGAPLRRDLRHCDRANATSLAPVAAPVAITTNCFPARVL